MASPVAGAGGFPLTGALLPIAIGGGLIVARSAFEVSSRLGFPGILGVLLLGIGFGVPLNEGLVGSSTVETMHLLALAMLLFYAGLCADIANIRRILVYGLLLALVGVMVSSLALGLFLYFFGSADVGSIELGFGSSNSIPIGVALLLASCLGSTDAGATFSVLNTVKNRLPPALTNTLEFESSVNDPSAILFFGLVSGLFFQAGSIADADTTQTVMAEIGNFSRLVFTGVVMGFITSFAARFAVALFNDEESRLIVIIATVMAVYGVTSFFGGSGLLAAYVCGVILNQPYDDDAGRGVSDTQSIRTLLAPVNSLAEYVTFLLLGMLVSWQTMLSVFPLAILVSLGLNLICRPLSIALLARYSPLGRRESLFLSWCGLRGAVPLALAFELGHKLELLPGLSSQEISTLSQNSTALIFDVVLLSLLIQGSTLTALARVLKIETNSAPDSKQPEAAST
jgi:potassium/hydrogen antiporter